MQDFAPFLSSKEAKKARKIPQVAQTGNFLKVLEKQILSIFQKVLGLVGLVGLVGFVGSSVEEYFSFGMQKAPSLSPGKGRAKGLPYCGFAVPYACFASAFLQ